MKVIIVSLARIPPITKSLQILLYFIFEFWWIFDIIARTCWGKDGLLQAFQEEKMLKGKVPLVIGIVLGLFAGLLSMFALKAKEREIKRGWNLREIIVAAQDITEGTTLEVDMLAKRSVPELFVTKSTIREKDLDRIIGQTVVVNLKEGDPLMWFHFQESHGFEKLSSIVQKRGRAITVRVNQESAVGNWIRPNDHVDILGAFRDPSSNNTIVSTLLQNILVLATGRITPASNINLIPENERNYGNVTLLVLPEEAEIILLAQEMGTLYLTLRNPDDLSQQAERKRITLEMVIQGDLTKELSKIRSGTFIEVVKSGR